MATLNLKNLPDTIYKKLKARAKQRHRCMAQEVIHLLSETLDKTETLSILELQGLGKECWKGIDPTVDRSIPEDESGASGTDWPVERLVDWSNPVPEHREIGTAGVKDAEVP